MDLVARLSFLLLILNDNLSAEKDETMGPLSLFVLNSLLQKRHDEDEPEHVPPRIGRFTLVQVKSLRGLNKGSIRIENPGILALKNGVDGYGKALYLARYRPGIIKSWKNARAVCQEIARIRYHFDLLFIDDHLDSERVRVLCPRCRTYWTWNEASFQNIVLEAGRLCTHCHG